MKRATASTQKSTRAASKVAASKPLTLTERKREDILRAAAEVFRRDGVRGASTDAIAERAGVSKRTLYNHFASKDALFDAVIERYWQRFAARFDEETDAALDLESRIVALSLARLQVLLDPELIGFFRAVLGESMRTPELARVWGHGVDALALLGLRAFVREERERGRLRFDDEEVAIAQLWALCFDPLFWTSVLLMRARVSHAEREATVREGAKTFIARFGAQATAERTPPKTRSVR
jgi:TetR/AcrR family transcriptional regulator of autoinduction and epiphytic fitness